MEIKKEHLDQLVSMVDEYFRLIGHETPLAIRFDYELQVGMLMIKPKELPSPVAFAYYINLLSDLMISELHDNLRKLQMAEMEQELTEKIKTTQLLSREPKEKM